MSARTAFPSPLVLLLTLILTLVFGLSACGATPTATPVLPTPTAIPPTPTPVPPTATAVPPTATPVPPTRTPVPPTPTPPPPTSTPRPTGTPTLAPSIDATYSVEGVSAMPIKCYGTGGPVVILEGGVAPPPGLWDRVYPTIAKQTMVCLFDVNLAARLHSILQQAKVAGPYILVGQSLSGLNTRAFYSLWPKEVAGIVLADAAQPDFCKRELAVLPAQTATEDTRITNLRAQLLRDAGMLERYAAQAPPVTSFGNLPLIVLTHTPGRNDMIALPALAEKLETEWQAMDEEIAKMSTNGAHIVSKQSSHIIPMDDPELVISAILEVLKKARGK